MWCVCVVYKHTCMSTIHVHLWLHAETRGEIRYATLAIVYLIPVMSLSLKLEPGCQPADASNPPVSTPYSVGVYRIPGI